MVASGFIAGSAHKHSPCDIPIPGTQLDSGGGGVVKHILWETYPQTSKFSPLPKTFWLARSDGHLLNNCCT